MVRGMYRVAPGKRLLLNICCVTLSIAPPSTPPISLYASSGMSFDKAVPSDSSSCSIVACWLASNVPASALRSTIKAHGRFYGGLPWNTCKYYRHLLH